MTPPRHSDAPLCDARAAPQVGGVAQGRSGRRVGVGSTGDGFSERDCGMAASDDEQSPSEEKGNFDFGTLGSWQVYDKADGETLALFPEGDKDAGVGRGGPKRDLAKEEKDEREEEEKARYYEKFARENEHVQPPPFVSSASESDDDGDGGGSSSPSLLDKG